MIIVKLQGGLGNQLFQYALGRHLAQKNNVPVKFDISWYATQDLREYELKYFNIQENIATDKEVGYFKKYQPKNRKIWFLYNLLVANNSIYVREKDYAFNQKILDISDNAYLDGIWLSEKYFTDIADIIRKEITLKIPLPEKQKAIQQEMNNSQSVAICIRRGDFISNQKVSSIHGLLSMDYYDKAIKLISDNIKEPKFFVFSDDIEWVRNNLKIQYPLHFVSDGHRTISSWQELILMSECKHTISANSSFSWWAGWLNKNPNKIVIFPEKWFKQDSRNSPDLIPSSWITIPNTHQ